MAVLLSLALLFSMLFLSTASSFGNNDVIVQRLVMPDVQVPRDDLYLCTEQELNPADGAFMVGFENIDKMRHGHHATLVICASRQSDQPYWECGNHGLSNATGIPPICKDTTEHIFMGDQDLKQLQLPEDVGFKVGGVSGSQYLVFQVHYAHALPAGERDNSELLVYKTNRPLTKIASSITMYSLGSIPAHSLTSMEISCPFQEKKTIHPYAYEVHTHELGVLVSGYFVTRNETSGLDDWVLLAERSPQLPQVLIPIERTIDVKPGDRLAVHCWINNTKDHGMEVGPSLDKNEMCVFYLFYWVEDDSTLSSTKDCGSAGPPEYSWATSNDFNNIPEPEVPVSGQRVGGN